MSVKQSNGRMQVTTPSEQPSPELLGRMVALLRAAYPYLEMTAETAELYLREMSVLGCEVGKHRLEAAIRACLHKCKMFPSIAEIREHVPAETAKPRMNYDSKCKICGGLGWKNVGPADPTPDNPNPKADRYTRCDCAHVIFVTP